MNKEELVNNMWDLLKPYDNNCVDILADFILANFEAKSPYVYRGEVASLLYNLQLSGVVRDFTGKQCVLIIKDNK